MVLATFGCFDSPFIRSLVKKLSSSLPIFSVCPRFDQPNKRNKTLLPLGEYYEKIFSLNHIIFHRKKPLNFLMVFRNFDPYDKFKIATNLQIQKRTKSDFMPCSLSFLAVFFYLPAFISWAGRFFPPTQSVLLFCFFWFYFPLIEYSALLLGGRFAPIKSFVFCSAVCPKSLLQFGRTAEHEKAALLFLFLQHLAKII